MTRPSPPIQGREFSLQECARRLQHGQLNEAARICRRLLEAAPKDADALHLLGLIAHRGGDLVTAKAQLRKAVKARPGIARFHNSLGVVLRARGELDAARAAQIRAIRLRPDFAGAHFNLGLIHEDLGDFASALSAYEATCKHAPEMAAAHHARGLVLEVLGRLQEAQSAFRRALEIRPEYPEAHFHLAHVRRAKEPEDAQLARIDALLAEHRWPPRETGWLQAARGKLNDDLGRYDQAFEAYRRANEQVAANHDADARDEWARRLARGFSASILQRGTEAALARTDRIFIVGMPRSGTTLLEAMLARHPRVEAGGERKELQAALAEAADAVGLREPEHWAEADLETLRRAASILDRRLPAPGQGTFLTDKLPGNIWNLWLVGLLLPHTPVLFTRRDPRDVGLSCYFTRFEEGQEFSYDLYHCGRQIRTVQWLADHWLAALPNPSMVVDYERLVTEPETTIREAFECCSLDLPDEAAEPSPGQETVTTASSWQVRQGLYTRAIKRWRNYESHLGPLLDGLGPLVADTHTGHITSPPASR